MIKSYLKDEDGIIHINPFICPECGSKDDTYTAYQLLIDKVKLDDPWYTEFEFINCMSCRRSIPGTHCHQLCRTSILTLYFLSSRVSKIDIPARKFY